jgi:hypothetical protein
MKCPLCGHPKPHKYGKSSVYAIAEVIKLFPPLFHPILYYKPPALDFDGFIYATTPSCSKNVKHLPRNSCFVSQEL